MQNVLFQLTTEKTISYPAAKSEEQNNFNKGSKTNFSLQQYPKKNKQKAEKICPTKPGIQHQHIKTSSLFTCNPEIPTLKV